MQKRLGFERFPARDAPRQDAGLRIDGLGPKRGESMDQITPSPGIGTMRQQRPDLFGSVQPHQGLRLHQPVVYQDIAGVKHAIPCQYVLVPGPEGAGTAGERGNCLSQLVVGMVAIGSADHILCGPQHASNVTAAHAVHARPTPGRIESLTRSGARPTAAFNGPRPASQPAHNSAGSAVPAGYKNNH